MSPPNGGYFAPGAVLVVSFSHVDQYHLDIEWEVQIANRLLTFSSGATATMRHFNVPPHRPQAHPEPLAIMASGTETLAYVRVRYRGPGWPGWRTSYTPTSGHSCTVVV